MASRKVSEEFPDRHMDEVRHERFPYLRLQARVVELGRDEKARDSRLNLISVFRGEDETLEKKSEKKMDRAIDIVANMFS